MDGQLLPSPSFLRNAEPSHSLNPILSNDHRVIALISGHPEDEEWPTETLPAPFWPCYW